MSIRQEETIIIKEDWNLERCLPTLILVKEPRANGWGIYSETEDSETSLGVYPKVLNWLSKSSFGF